MRLNLFIDIDGVILGKAAPGDSEIILARHAEEFVGWALERFDCYWLTTQCRGDKQAVLSYLSPFCDEGAIRVFSRVRPTNFKTLKTEALSGDFFWIDDDPLACEIEWLERHGLLGRWIRVNTRNHTDDLLNAKKILEAHLHGRERVLSGKNLRYYRLSRGVVDRTQQIVYGLFRRVGLIRTRPARGSVK